MSERVQKLWAVGQKIKESKDRLKPYIQRSAIENPWFITKYYQKAIDELVHTYLSKSALEEIERKYTLPDAHGRQVGLIMAGNIPLVGVQDLIHSYLAGYSISIKLSAKDRFVWPELLKIWTEVDENHQIEIVDKLKTHDYVIATGSDNSVRKIKNYFKDVQGIYRGHRTSVAVLSGEENLEDLKLLYTDVFSYFGLGCRNISKLYVPVQYDFAPLMDALIPADVIRNHSKYINNYEYNYAMIVMNQVAHVTNGHLLMFENSSLHSRVSTVHFEYYESEDQLRDLIKRDTPQIQCISSKEQLKNIPTVPLGMAQKPRLLDYADNIDTIKTLTDWLHEQ